jgi:hypothetical protein
MQRVRILRKKLQSVNAGEASRPINEVQCHIATEIRQALVDPGDRMQMPWQREHNQHKNAAWMPPNWRSPVGHAAGLARTIMVSSARHRGPTNCSRLAQGNLELANSLVARE